MLIAATSHDSYLYTDLPPLLRRNPGVLVVTHRPLHISYINVQARSIINTLHHLECGIFRRGLPNAVMAFCLDLLEALDDCCDTDMPAPSGSQAGRLSFADSACRALQKSMNPASAS